VVNCLYFVAEGTLDILLWDLLEKKFRDLGEFVEGKEKMKIVVHKIYDSVKDLQSIFSNPADYDFDSRADLKSDEESSEDGEVLIKLEEDLAEDITQLAQEEMGMIAQAEGDDDDGGDCKGSNEETIAENPIALQGSTADDAICLSDDDDDEIVEVEKVRSEEPAASSTPQKIVSAPIAPSNEPGTEFQDARLYKQIFDGDSFGFQLVPFRGKLMVGRNNTRNAKPAPGDMLVSMNGIPFAHNLPLNHATPMMKSALFKGPVELTFIEDKKVAGSFARYSAFCNNEKPATNPIVENEVIELLDDD
jgi:hypothetical protein